MAYTELQTTTNFSFLRGASHPEELVQQAKEYGYTAIAITDRNTLAGVVRAHAAGKEQGIRVLPACRLELLDGPSVLAYPTDKEAWSGLSGLLTTGNLRAEKGQCHLYKADVYAHAKGMRFVLLPPTALTPEFELDAVFRTAAAEYREALGPALYLAASRSYLGDDTKRLHRLSQLATGLSMPLVATNDVHYHSAERRQLQDILTCIREKCTIQTAGFRLYGNAERHLKPIPEMLRLFRQYPDAILRTQEIAEACCFSLDLLKYVYPEELTTEGRTPQEELTKLTWEGAKGHFGDNVPAKIRATIEHELSFIGKMNYASYFLTVHDLVRFARSLNILCQGRGSAANSTVCFCLGITSVNPAKFDLLFERFLSSARNEPPDIDVDFEHERREEVIQYIYKKYGRDRAAIVATVTQERRKGAIRDVGKAMGLSVDTIQRLSSSSWRSDTELYDEHRLSEQGLNPHDPHLIKVLGLTCQLMGFPRQLGQHTGGFVITQGKLTELCPIMNARMEDRTCIEWNKDDIDVLGFLKIDVLALGMLTCIRKAFNLAKQHYGLDLTLANIPQDDPAVYEMVSHADTIGVFQIESRAQQAMLPRLRPKCFYDLVIEVAIVRPGPIQGDMVHPYLRRRDGLEPVEFPSEELKNILGKTLGVPLFQEQAMQVAIVAAGFTPSEADALRRSMATFKAQGQVTRFQEKLINGMLAKGYKREYAERIFKQLEGFGSYGFPESHAVSFALLVYVSSWLKCYYPDVFAAALLNSLPMGFYQPAQLVIDAQKHGVEVLPVDVNFSQWDQILEVGGGDQAAGGGFASGGGHGGHGGHREVGHGRRYRSLRLGFRQVSGFREEDAQALVAGRDVLVAGHDAVVSGRDVLVAGRDAAVSGRDGLAAAGGNVLAAGGAQPAGYTSITAVRDAGVPDAALERLADADAFRSLGLDRRRALWEVTALADRPVALFAGVPGETARETAVSLPEMTAAEHVVQDYASTTLSLKAHPVSFVREKLDLLRILPAGRLAGCRDGDLVKVAGLVLVRQQPGTASGVVFITIEDESGTANLVVFHGIFEAYRKVILQSRLLLVEGKLQIEGEVVHVIVKHCHNLSPLLRDLVTPTARNFK